MNNGREITVEEIAEAFETAERLDTRSDAEKAAAAVAFAAFYEQVSESYREEEAAKKEQK